MRVVAFAAALYLLTPGHPDVMLAGVPLGQTGTFLLVSVLVAWAWTRDVAVAPRPWVIRALGGAVAIKLLLALAVPASGWLANYHSDDGRLRQSLDFRGLDATRIDRQLSFVDTEFPVHFFNEHGFNYGVRREASEPFAVLWRGHVHERERTSVRFDARGEVQVTVDGAIASGNPFVLEPGDHIVEVRYRKPKDLEGALHVEPLDAAGAPRPWAIGEVTPAATPPAQRSLARALAPLAWANHMTAALLVIIGLRPSVAAKLKRLRELTVLDAAGQLVVPVVMLGLTVQGLFKSRQHVGRVFTFTGGDDWLAFEMNARDIFINGLLSPRGTVPGKGLPFFEYPGYGYFLAGAHWLTGESIAGVVLANFIVLAGATILVYFIARRLTGPLAALCAVAWLLAVQQLDFVRYYTVTLLSENLYFFVVPLTIYWVLRFIQDGRWWTLAAGGVACGYATATRPTMQLFVPVILLVLAVTQWRGGLRRTVLAPALFVLCFFVGVGPFTYRNYVMSGKAVLVTEGQARTFVNYNLPEGVPTQKYFYAFHDTNLSAAKVLLMILWDHPAQTLKAWGTKTLFGFGMVHWMGAANRPHPELLLTSAMYLLAIVLLREARTPGAWLVHGFVATHLATLLLTSPANYGYRMVLSMYVFMVIFAGALVARGIERWKSGRNVVAPA